MNIAFVSDNNYAQHTGVLLTSILENSSDPSDIHIYYIHWDLSLENKMKFEYIKKKYNTNISYIKGKKKMFEGYFERFHINSVTYNKFILGDLLPSNIEKVLYLDSDMIVTSDLLELELINLNGNVLAAVCDENKTFAQNIGKLEEEYFNSGLMYIDLKMLRKKEVSTKCIDFVNSELNKFQTCDQDALNFTIQNEWVKLPNKWNYMWGQHTKKEFIEKKPNIVHFISEDKPWNYLQENPYAHIYNKYLNLSPWYGYIPFEKNILETNKLIIYGASSGGRKMYNNLKSQTIDIIFFVDGDPKKWNTEFEGKKVYNPEFLNRDENKGAYVIIPSITYYQEISNALINMNYQAVKGYKKLFYRI